MNLLTLEHISKRFGDKTLLEDADFYLAEGEKTGIVGINGTGKSTLLRLIAGIEEPDTGSRTIAVGTVVRMLPQNPVYPKGQSILDFVLADEPETERWGLEPEARNLLTRFGLSDYQADVSLLSGGQKRRAALARALVRPADLLLLDEPTNHLDADMSEWLEQYLSRYKGAMVLVTHDRYFLDQVTGHITEIDRGKLYGYEGNFSVYLEKKAERIAGEDSAAAKRRNLLRTELAWLNRGARARSTKQKAHINRIEALQDIRDPQHERQVDIPTAQTRLGRTTLEVEDLAMAWNGRTVFSGFSYIFLKNDRIGIIGPNGCGKTTLMRILAGDLEPAAGTRIAGKTLKISYYTQEIASDPSAGLAYMDPEKRVLDYIRDTAEYIRTDEGLVTASVMLDRFLFPPAVQMSRIGNLSGGEKKRLYLLRVLMEAPNLLILDEPANDLDISTMNILEDYLDHFEGIVITVSHDRYFLDRTVRRIFAFEDGKLVQYEGGYADYASAHNAKLALAAENATAAKPKAKDPVRESNRNSRPRKLRMTWQEQKDFETIEEDIAALEESIEQLDSAMSSAATDFVKLAELTQKKEEAEVALEQKMDRWVYLTDLQAKIEEENAGRN